MRGRGGEFTLLSFFSFILNSIFCFVFCFVFPFSGVRCVIWTVAGRTGKKRVFFLVLFKRDERKKWVGLYWLSEAYVPEFGRYFPVALGRGLARGRSLCQLPIGEGKIHLCQVRIPLPGDSVARQGVNICVHPLPHTHLIPINPHTTSAIPSRRSPASQNPLPCDRQDGKGKIPRAMQKPGVRRSAESQPQPLSRFSEH